MVLTNSVDSDDRREEFKNDPKAYEKYCRDLEGELNKRFTLVSASIV